MNPTPTIKTYHFNETRVNTLIDDQELNWPVVYQIYDGATLYVGETTNLRSRMLQHLKNIDKNNLKKFSVVFDKTYNKSVALDLESQLIQWFSGDGKFKVLNRNDGISNHEYYNRSKYNKFFASVWDKLRKVGLANNSITTIENSELFKFSPYKRLNDDQLQVVYNVLENLDEALENETNTISIIGGKEGTGKTIVIMYLVKLIRDIQDYKETDDVEEEQEFAVFFKKPFKSRFENKTIAIVIPNQSLKGSIKKICKTITNLSDGSIDILSPIEFGSSNKKYDIVFVDEAHLLKRSGWSQQSAKANAINKKLFNGELRTEFDWIVKKSNNIVMVYGNQRIRQINVLNDNIKVAAKINNHQVRNYLLKEQMRSRGGKLYIDYLQSIFSDIPPANKQNFDNFEFKLYDDFKDFVNNIREKDEEVGLSRLVAGFAWKWKSKHDKSAYDIEIDGIKLKWNSVLNNWIGSPRSVEEVGSIYTIQGFDLNYCGVIIGNDLQYDSINKKLVFNRSSYHDVGAINRSKQQIDADIQLTDKELLEQVVRTYRILMNRSIRGTFVYVCDDNLREYLSQYINKN